MSAITKLVKRFKSCPADFTWGELVRLLSSFGYEMRMGKGSARRFVGDDLPTIALHEPHPQKIMKRYALRQVCETLEREGLI